MRLRSRLRISVLLVVTGCLVTGQSGRGEQAAGSRLGAGWQVAVSGQIRAGDIVGAWALVSVEEQRPDGTVIHSMGRNPRGLIVYDETGHVSVQIMRDPVPNPAWDDLSASPADLRRAYEGYYAYFGTYEVDERAATVTHHVRGSMRPFEIGHDYRRGVRLFDDRLVLSLSETRSLTWRRLR